MFHSMRLTAMLVVAALALVTCNGSKKGNTPQGRDGSATPTGAGRR